MFYCYARTYHEYLGFSAGLDFESKIVVKPDAPALLEKELSRRQTCPGKIAMSGVTDCYQPAERMLMLPGNHDLNVVDRANPARLDLPMSPARRLRQMRALSAIASTQSSSSVRSTSSTSCASSTSSSSNSKHSCRRST